jgi:CysZ protein
MELTMSQSPHGQRIRSAGRLLPARLLTHPPAGIRTFVLIPLLVNFVLFAGAFYALPLQLDGLFAWLPADPELALLA